MFLYEMHCHTTESSKCAQSTGEEMVDFFKKIGYSGICITDHFFNGNCAISNDIPWKERVNAFCKGYENAKKHGDEIGLSVFFGWECSYGGCDILTYGLTKEWLLEHKDCDKLEPPEYIDLVHESGGHVVHAHPFREREYITYFKLMPRKVDAVEIFNACNDDFSNEMAEIYANKYELPISAGSDIHVVEKEILATLGIEKKAENLLDIIHEILYRKAVIGKKFIKK